jgi:hypothetical protein
MPLEFETLQVIALAQASLQARWIVARDSREGKRHRGIKAIPVDGVSNYVEDLDMIT